MATGLFTKKPLGLLLEEMKGENRLRRILGPVGLTSLGVGAIIGTGIFVITGTGALIAGPSLILSFVLSGMACVFAALCYAEFASMVPVAGSAYTYAYATLGEMMAWIIGWDLVLEYAVSSATVAHGWSAYFQNLINIFGVHLPAIFRSAPFDFNNQASSITITGSWFDLPAIIITFVITVVLVKGIRESAGFNAIMVGIKLVIVLLVISVGVFYINPANWQPFAPHGFAGIAIFGKTILGDFGAKGAPLGMVAGAAIIFFAYIGFDSVSTHAEEAKNPSRDVPIGIIASLLISTILYILVAAVLTGMVPYSIMDNSKLFNINAPVAEAFRLAGITWAQFLISLGAIVGITSVLLVMMLSQPRILLAIARDGLLPKGFFGAVHEKFRTPYKSTILTGLFVATLAAFLPLGILAELVNIGTLLAFVIVCAAVLIMRFTHPEAKRPFKAPFVPLVPILGILFCLLLMFSLPSENWLRLLGWLLLGFAIYFAYGRRHSVMARIRRGEPVEGYNVPIQEEQI